MWWMRWGEIIWTMDDDDVFMINSGTFHLKMNVREEKFCWFTWNALKNLWTNLKWNSMSFLKNIILALHASRSENMYIYTGSQLLKLMYILYRINIKKYGYKDNDDDYYLRYQNRVLCRQFHRKTTKNRMIFFVWTGRSVLLLYLFILDTDDVGIVALLIIFIT